MWRHNKKMAVYEPGTRLLPDWNCQGLVLGLPAYRTTWCVFTVSFGNWQATVKVHDLFFFQRWLRGQKTYFLIISFGCGPPLWKPNKTPASVPAISEEGIWSLERWTPTQALKVTHCWQKLAVILLFWHIMEAKLSYYGAVLLNKDRIWRIKAHLLDTGLLSHIL